MLAKKKTRGSGRFLEVGLAREDRQIRDAQRLRWEIFGLEMGAELQDEAGDGLDSDRFDPFCDHLVVHDRETGQLVGTTRLLGQEMARKAGGFYSETEFDLAPVLRNRRRVLEIGRTCIHPEYRSGAAIATLWTGLAPILVEQKYRYLIGCASIPLSEGMGPVRALLSDLIANHGCAEDRRAIPRLPLPSIVEGRAARPYRPPALLKAYLRLGAKICGEAAWDPDFKTADVLVLLDLRALKGRYARHFLGDLMDKERLVS